RVSALPVTTHSGSSGAVRSYPARWQYPSVQSRSTSTPSASASGVPSKVVVGKPPSGVDRERSRESTAVLAPVARTRWVPSCERARTSCAEASTGRTPCASSSWLLPSARRTSTGASGSGRECTTSPSPSAAMLAVALCSSGSRRVATTAGVVRAAARTRASSPAAAPRARRGRRGPSTASSAAPSPAPASSPAARRSTPSRRCPPSRAQIPATARSVTAAPSQRAWSVPSPVSWFTRASPRGAVVGAGGLLPQGLEVAAVQGGADLVHQAHHEAFVVDRAQRRGEHLLGAEQVVHVRGGVVGAGVAVAALVDGGELAAVPCAGEVHPPGAGVDGAVARHTGRGDAVEGVGPGGDSDEQVVDLADAQQVAGPGLGQLVGHPADDRAQVLLLERAADAEAVEAPALHVHRAEVAGGLPAQILVLGALDHAPQLLVGAVGALGGEPCMLGEAADRPQAGAFERLLLVAAGVHEGGELVEGEHDVRAEPVLDLHR